MFRNGATMHTLNDILKFAVTLLSIINPLGVIPVFLGFTQVKKNLNIQKISNACAVTTSITIFISLFFGQNILSFFGISIPSFTIGGGMLLFTMAFSMIAAHQSDSKINTEELEKVGMEKELGIIPLAIPLLAGPGAISISIIQAKNFSTTYHWLGACIVVILIGVVIKLLLTFAQEIGRKIGQIGINIMTRIMGLILLAISIEMIASGMKEMMPVLKGGIAFLSA